MPAHAAKIERIRKAAALALLWVSSTPTFADIGTHSETSPEVRVYRSLQDEFLDSKSGRKLKADLARTLCRGRPTSGVVILTEDSDGRPSEMNGDGILSLACVQRFEDTCKRSPFGVSGATSWREQARRIAFTTYIRELVR